MVDISWTIKVRNTGPQNDIIAGCSLLDPSTDEELVPMPWWIIWNTLTDEAWTVSLNWTSVSIPPGVYWAKARAWTSYSGTPTNILDLSNQDGALRATQATAPATATPATRISYQAKSPVERPNFIAGIALVRGSVSGLVEAQVTSARTKEKIADGVLDGTITPEEGNELLEGVENHWGSDIPWTTIIVGGMIGVGALVALSLYLKK